MCNCTIKNKNTTNSNIPTRKEQQQKSKKRVRFLTNDHDGTMKTSSVGNPHIRITALDDQVLWWSREEMIEIRKNAYAVTQAVKGSGDKLYEDARKNSYCKTIARVIKCCNSNHKKELSPSLHGDLSFWFGVGHSRRGLEKFILDQVRTDRDRRRRKVTSGVLFIQHRCDLNCITDETRERMLRIASERGSQPAKDLAVALARADAVAAITDMEAALAAQMIAKEVCCRMTMQHQSALTIGASSSASPENRDHVEERRRRPASTVNPAA